MDYCTLWFEGFWSDCCKAHDLAYDMQIPRAIADADLTTCVALATNSPGAAWVGAIAAGVMFVGVRVFGKRFYKKAAKE